MFKMFKKIFKVGIVTEPIKLRTTDIENLGKKCRKLIDKYFAGSLAIRAVDAGSCNGCELEIHAINNPIYNCERFGIHFTASPRFADMLLVSGPVTRNMEIAVRRTYNSTPSPKFVVAIGDCGCNGGIFGESYASLGSIDKVIPVDVFIPGCPPTPSALLNGILRAVGSK